MPKRKFNETTYIRKQPIEKGKAFVQRVKETELAAARALTANEFKVWIFFSGNADGWKVTWTRQDIVEAMGMSESTVYRVVTSLIDKGYLVERTDGIYEFFENPEDERKSKIGNNIVYKYD